MRGLPHPACALPDASEFFIVWDKYRLFRAASHRDAATWVEMIRKVQDSRQKTAEASAAVGVGEEMKEVQLTPLSFVRLVLPTLTSLCFAEL